MHAAWFFGQPWHFEGYKLFIQVPIKKTTHFLVTPLMMKCCIRRSPRTRMSGSCRWRPASTTWRTPSPTSNSLQLVWHLHLHHLHLHHCIVTMVIIMIIPRQDKRAFRMQRHRGADGEVRVDRDQMWKRQILQVRCHSHSEKIPSEIEVLKSDGLDPT